MLNTTILAVFSLLFNTSYIHSLSKIHNSPYKTYTDFSFVLLKIYMFIIYFYLQGIQSFRASRDGSPLPGAREVSFTINEDRDSPHYIHSAMLLQFGQFMDHDMTLTAISKIPIDPTGKSIRSKSLLDTGEIIKTQSGKEKLLMLVTKDFFL